MKYVAASQSCDRSSDRPTWLLHCTFVSSRQYTCIRTQYYLHVVYYFLCIHQINYTTYFRQDDDIRANQTPSVGQTAPYSYTTIAAVPFMYIHTLRLLLKLKNKKGRGTDRGRERKRDNLGITCLFVHQSDSRSLLDISVKNIFKTHRQLCTYTTRLLAYYTTNRLSIVCTYGHTYVHQSKRESSYCRVHGPDAVCLSV